jgi:chlorobactene glucosyltransferase
MWFVSYLILAFWILALARTILNLALVPRLQPRLPRTTPLVSVIVPARNEERTIERTVRALLSQTWPSLQVIVVDDRSADGTGSILERLAREDPRLLVVSGEEPPAGWLGKPWALHQGSARARGEILLFMDADVVYSPDAITAAVVRLEDSDAAMLSLFPRLEMGSFWEKVTLPNLAVIGFTILPLWLSNRTRLPLIGVGGGPGNLIRREAYESAGGHEALKDAVVDDVALARRVRKRGGRTEVVRADDLISIRMYHGLREIIDGFTKNAFATFNRSYLLTGSLMTIGFFFHALPYGLALGGDSVALASLGVIVLTRLVLFVSVGYGVVNALFGHLPMMLVWFYILVRSIWVTGVRGELLWRGRSYDAARTRFGAD